MTEGVNRSAANNDNPFSDPRSGACPISGLVESLDDSGTPHSRSWTFLTNHAHVLLLVARQPETRVRDLARDVGVTERCIQRILTELEEAGYVTRVHQGRRNYYEIHADMPLRHPVEQHQQVSALLNLVLGGQGYNRHEER